MERTCDICGKHLAITDVWTIRAATVMEAASKGFVPAGLPLNWWPRLPVVLEKHWHAVVKMHSTSDWGLCKECLHEVAQFKSEVHTSQPDPQNLSNDQTLLNGEILVLASVYCASILRMEGEEAIVSLDGGGVSRDYSFGIISESGENSAFDECHPSDRSQRGKPPSRGVCEPRGYADGHCRRA